MAEATKKQANLAQAAQVEDYDSDESRVVDGTARIASSQVGARPQSSSRRPNPTKTRSHRDSHSDSGYISRTTTKNPAAPTTTTSSRPVVQHAAVATTPTKTSSSKQEALNKRSGPSKPVIHRYDSGRTSAQPPSNHTACTDPYCRDPHCDAQRVKERRKTIVAQPLPPEQHPQPQQYPVLHQYHRPAQYQYVSAQDLSNMPPPMPPAPRQRPASVYGYAMPSGQMPQPSPHYASYAPQPQMYTTQAPIANMGAVYQPASPVMPSPTSPTYPLGYPTQTSHPISARQVNPALPVLGPPKIAPLPDTRPHVSARRVEDKRYHDQLEPYSSESDFTLETDYSSSENDRRPRRRASHRRRPSEKAVTVIPHPSRPAAKKYYTEQQTLPTRSRRDTRPQQPLPRSGRSDGDVYYSDVGDSDRTARAVVDRPSYPSTSSTRRPSIATTSSSGRTKATMSSSNTDYSSHNRILVEGKHNRRSMYLPKDQRADLRQQQKIRDEEEAARRLKENVDAYQRGMNGNLDPHELTAENMRRKDGGNRPRSASYISNTRSHRSSASQGGGVGGIKIQSGGTVLHVYGDAKVEMRAGENGEPASFVIGAGSGGVGLEGGGVGGGGSRSSRSGRGKSDVRQKIIREENSFDDGYERGM